MVQSSLPPGPKSKLQILNYIRDPYAFMEKTVRRYGSIFTLDSPNGRAVITTVPEGAREILTGRGSDFYVGFGTEIIESLVGPGSLLTISGDRHRMERNMLSPTFHGQRMRAYGSDILEATLRTTSSWQSGAQLNAQECMQSISIDVILRAVFGVQRPEEMDAFKESIRGGFSEVNPLLVFFKFLQKEMGGIGPWARFKRSQREFHSLIHDRIADARRLDSPGEDVLSRLAAARYEDGSVVPDEAIRDHVVTMLIAGHETTATTLAWAMAELALHPEVVSRIRDEVASLGPNPTPDAIASLEYLDAVGREVLRLHPIIAEFFRTVKTDTFPLQGWNIPADMSIGASILMIQRDPELYPEPLKFKPERFLERRFAPHEFAAFGGGHRHCIGSAFAMNEIKIVLGTIVPRFDWSLQLDHPPKVVRRNITLAPEKGAPIQIERVVAPARAA
jgi:cytochrome P450